MFGVAASFVLSAAGWWALEQGVKYLVPAPAAYATRSIYYLFKGVPKNIIQRITNFYVAEGLGNIVFNSVFGNAGLIINVAYGLYALSKYGLSAKDVAELSKGGSKFDLGKVGKALKLAKGNDLQNQLLNLVNDGKVSKEDIEKLINKKGKNLSDAEKSKVDSELKNKLVEKKPEITGLFNAKKVNSKHKLGRVKSKPVNLSKSYTF